MRSNESQTDSDWVHQSKQRNKGSMFMKRNVFASVSNRMCICFLVGFLVMPQERPLVEKCKIDAVYEAEESEAQK